MILVITVVDAIWELCKQEIIGSNVSGDSYIKPVGSLRSGRSANRPPPIPSGAAA